MKLRLAFPLILILLATPSLASGNFSTGNIIEVPTPSFNSQFGYKIDSDGQRLMIAEYSQNAYLYQNSELKILPVPKMDKLFEPSIDITENNMIIGYVSTNYNGFDAAGVAYLFDAEGYSMDTIFPPEPINWGHFGSSVLLGAEYVYVGEAWADHIEVDEGKVHRYSYDGNYLDSMVPPESRYAATFGARLEGNFQCFVVSELNGVHGMLNNGEVHLYDWNGELAHTLTSLNSTALNDFGASLAMSTDYIVIGESIAQIEDYKRAGRAYVYSMEGDLLNVLEPPDPFDGGLYGFSVAVNDEYIAVGEPRANGVDPLEGAVHIYSLDGEYIETIYSPLGESNSEFGKSLCFSGTKLYVGQPGASVNLMINAGRVIEYSPTRPEPDPANMTLVYSMTIVLAATVVLFILKMRQDQN
ncbi:FG-GAP repeat protein [archaeon]|nr:FG-GAP repeat protein [archaeon]